MRIALVSDWYAPRLGGIEAHLVALKERLERAGHEVHVVTTTPGDESETVHRVRARRLPKAEVMFTPGGAKGIGLRVDRESIRTFL